MNLYRRYYGFLVTFLSHAHPNIITNSSYFFPVKFSLLKFVLDGSLNARFVALRDVSTQKPIKVCLFVQQAEIPPQAADIVSVTNVYPYRRRNNNKGEETLPTSLGSKPSCTVDVGISCHDTSLS